MSEYEDIEKQKEKKEMIKMLECAKRGTPQNKRGPSAPSDKTRKKQEQKVTTPSKRDVQRSNKKSNKKKKK
jgi:hypothetical protein